MTHLTEKECQMFLDIKKLGDDIRTSENGAELLGKEVVAFYFNSGLNGHCFVVKDLGNGEFGDADAESVYTMTWAYMVVFKVTVDEYIDEYKLKYFKQRALQFKHAYNTLLNAWNDLSPEQSDMVNGTNSYPFQSSFDEYDVNTWVDAINKLDN